MMIGGIFWPPEAMCVLVFKCTMTHWKCILNIDYSLLYMILHVSQHLVKQTLFIT